MNNTDYPSNAEPVGQPIPWYEVWSDVLTHPSRDTFRRILADPTAGTARAFMWVGLVSLIGGILQAVVLQVAGISPMEQFGGAGVLTNVICFAIATPILSIIGLALGSAILRGIASLFGGTGNFNNMVYAMAAISAPFSIISTILSLISNVLTGGANFDTSAGGLGAGSVAGLCIAPILLAVGIYGIVLQVQGVGEVEKLTTGKAVMTVLLPAIALLLLGLCLALTVGAAIFSQFGGQLPQ